MGCSEAGNPTGRQLLPHFHTFALPPRGIQEYIATPTSLHAASIEKSHVDSSFSTIALRLQHHVSTSTFEQTKLAPKKPKKSHEVLPVKKSSQDHPAPCTLHIDS
ncbi:hypothetical protein B0O99DRAFT_633410 [Bisporella sp. PMI_857]|nr:hypothetical protein B0O99DRAFT_633410 [Bisporella sp. PMI_857]